MTRWVDPNRPHTLTVEQSQSVVKRRRLRQLLAQRARWNHRYKGAATKQPGYRSLSNEIVNLRQRLRAALLKQLRDKWDTEHPVNEVELQLSGLKFCDGSGTSVHIVDKMPLMQRRLAEMVMTLPGTTVAEEFCRRCLLPLPAEGGGRGLLPDHARGRLRERRVRRR
jgi:hypothetical protein